MPKIRDRRTRLHLESLEDRRVPATWGIPWADPQHITASFVPDGTTSTAGSSNLFKMLDSQLGAASGWETTILKALQTWAVNSNINIGLVTDGGEPLGTAGQAQGDARFGDIRISAEPLPSGVVAITSPYSPEAGTYSGDIILNSNDDFNPADPGSYDLYTIALHEAGHVFGFADSTDPSSFMYNVYQGPQTGLASGAGPALQALYGGPRNIDAIDNIPVSTTATSPVAVASPSGITASVSVSGDIASAQTSNYFSVQGGSTLTAPFGETLSIQTAGLSLLAPKVTVYATGSGNSLGAVVASSSTTSPLTGEVSVQIPSSLFGGQKYIVQVQGATGNVFSVGSYELTLGSSNPLSLGQSMPSIAAQAFAEAGNYTGSTPLTAGNSISGSDQINLYSFKTPLFSLGGATISLQDWGYGLVAPSITIYNSFGQEVGSATASSTATPTVSVNVGLMLPNSTYYVEVTNGLVNPIDFGTYQVSVAFSSSSGSSSTAFVQAVPWIGSNSDNASQAHGTLATAATLTTPVGDAANSVYEAIDGISSATPRQFYSLTSPSVPSGQTEVMTVSVQTIGNSTLQPTIDVYNQNGQLLNDQVLNSAGGVTVIEIALPSPGARYELEVLSSQNGGAQISGNFDLKTTFGSTLAAISPINSGTLGAVSAGQDSSEVGETLTIGEGQLYSFVLQGSASNTGTDAIMLLCLINSSGNIVADVAGPADDSESMIVCLPPGTYTVVVDAYSPSGAAIPALGYDVWGEDITDPILPFATTGSTGATSGSGTGSGGPNVVK